ncbi:MAG: DUF1501 domain-containing protein [Lentisphaeraceae bacterium]|nr:DUF1501 domain-containing protein [Lentisphaeraceae bacterium]
MINRRQFLSTFATAAGAIALPNSELMAGPLSPKQGHHKATAKRCIMLFMEGGPSHIDTFDPKPALEKFHMKEFVRNKKFKSGMESGKRYYIKSPFKFKQHGESGAWMSEPFQELGKVADDICFYRGAMGDSVNHPTACYQMNTGNQFIGDPGVGAWVTYGLGSENQDLPGFVVLPELNYPQGGSANWSNGYLPAYFQGTPMRPVGSPLLDISPPQYVSKIAQKKNLDLLMKLNKKHQQAHEYHDDLKARMEAYQLAYRMQDKVPKVVDLNSEPEHIKKMYGLGEKETDGFGRRCLLARKLVEQGVRFVEVYASGWDSHDYLERAHSSRIKSVDKPIAGLLQDLKQRGLLEDTLVWFCGEFGRSPDNGVRGGGKKAGRDHNKFAMPMWFAGGGVNAGQTIGATDEIGDKAVEVARHTKDVHKTILHLMGLDDNKLTFFHGGRNKQLSQVGADVIKEIIA